MKIPKKKKKKYPDRELNPGHPVCKLRVVTTVLRGSQLPSSFSFDLVYVIQEEIIRIPSEVETKTEPVSALMLT